MPEMRDEEMNFKLNEVEKSMLLKIARENLDYFFQHGTSLNIDKNQISENLLIEAGAFVTLKINKKLRGCIGRFHSDKAMYLLIQELSLSSAFKDPRFKPLKKKELRDLSIEISVLSPLSEIQSIDEIELGKHGIYIKSDMRSGTFLPQVATETGWNKEEFLGHCSRDKVGLGWDGWKSAQVYIYTADIFSED
jgi:MEMO1 family protein